MVKALENNKGYDIHMEVAVKNNFFGRLIYKSKTSGNEVMWNNYGDVNYLTIDELITMRNTQNSFFKNNWVIIDEGDETVDILKFLQVYRYYENTFKCSAEDLVKDTPTMIKKKISLVPKEARNNLVVSIQNLIENGEIDSIKKIKAFEDALGVSFGDFI